MPPGRQSIKAEIRKHPTQRPKACRQTAAPYFLPADITATQRRNSHRENAAVKITVGKGDTPVFYRHTQKIFFCRQNPPPTGKGRTPPPGKSPYGIFSPRPPAVLSAREIPPQKPLRRGNYHNRRQFFIFFFACCSPDVWQNRSLHGFSVFLQVSGRGYAPSRKCYDNGNHIAVINRTKRRRPNHYPNAEQHIFFRFIFSPRKFSFCDVLF